MLTFDRYAIGNLLLEYRKKAGLTQGELASQAGLCDRTYADIERGSVNMRTETLLRICQALHITPNDVLVPRAAPQALLREELLQKLNSCTPQQQTTALQLLAVYLHSLDQPVQDTAP